VNEDFYKRTLSGGIVTLVAAVVMLLLFISETSKCPPGGRFYGDLICFSFPLVSSWPGMVVEFEL
jgi:hypothetical protein